MAALVLASVFILTLAIGAAVSKGVLTLVLNLMAGGQVSTLASVRTIAAGLVALVR